MRKSIQLFFRIAGIVITLLWLSLPFSALAQTIKPDPQTCAVEINEPRAGANVRGDALVRGKAKIPSNSYLWILAHRKGLKGWWPQGGGDADIKEGEWEVLVKFGTIGEIGEFEIAAVVVDQLANEDLKIWVKDAPHNKYPPTSFPNPIGGCPIKTVTVVKVGD